MMRRARSQKLKETLGSIEIAPSKIIFFLDPRKHVFYVLRNFFQKESELRKVARTPPSLLAGVSAFFGGYPLLMAVKQLLG